MQDVTLNTYPGVQHSTSMEVRGSRRPAAGTFGSCVVQQALKLRGEGMGGLCSCAVQELDDVREFLLRALPEAPPPTRRVWALSYECEIPTRAFASGLHTFSVMLHNGATVRRLMPSLSGPAQ